MKPAIGATIYIPYKGVCICRETVFAENENGFVPSSILNRSKTEDYPRYLLYEDCDKTWFTDFEKVKQSMVKNSNVAVEKYYDDYWALIDYSLQKENKL